MNATEHLLSCLAEECAEVAQRASKALRFGLHEIQPGQQLNNAQRIAVEILDVLVLVEMLEDIKAIHVDLDRADWLAKKQKVVRFMKFAQQECGTLSGEIPLPASEGMI